jgi:Uma2 family endonuclease
MLDMSTLAKLSVSEYERIVASGVFDGRNARRIELIRGELRTMNPIGSEHATVVDRLNAWSFSATQRNTVWVRVQNPVAFLDYDSEPEPDLVWAKAGDYSAHHPQAEDVVLLIEVSESSLAFDQGEKALVYASAGIRDYWVVNLIDRTVDVHRDPQNGRYQSLESFGRDSIIAPLAVPDAQLRIALIIAQK